MYNFYIKHALLFFIQFIENIHTVEHNYLFSIVQNYIAIEQKNPKNYTRMLIQSYFQSLKFLQSIEIFYKENKGVTSLTVHI